VADIVVVGIHMGCGSVECSEYAADLGAVAGTVADLGQVDGDVAEWWASEHEKVGQG
jgi:hypothetical protein